MKSKARPRVPAASLPPLLLLLPLLLTPAAAAAPSLVATTSPDVRVVRDEAGVWSGVSSGMTHQNNPRYQAKKILDLSQLPESAWAACSEVRLSAFFCVRDFSLSTLGQANGLDEAFEVVINGKAHSYPTRGGAPVYAEGKAAALAWFDFDVPKTEFVRGPNEIVFRKANSPSGKEKQDDYLYLGIDNTEPRGNSQLSLDEGRTWSGKQLNTIGAQGEYMVRLFLLGGNRGFESAWRPGANPALTDPAGLILHAGVHEGEARLEWHSRGIDSAQPLTATVEAAPGSRLKLQWLDPEGKPMAAVPGNGPRFETALRGTLVSGVVVTGAPVQAMTLRGTRGYHEADPVIDLCPPVARPAASPAARQPSCRMERDGVVLENATLRCRFTTSGRRLQLASLFHELAGAEALREPGSADLFLVEIGASQFTGARDFECRSVQPAGPDGFTATLFLPAHSLEATLTGSIATDGLHLGLTLANRGAAPLDFKVAFPHLAGLALSADPAADYYFYPRGGGIIAGCPAVIRQGYGDHQALYQLMDVFSPARGAGLSVRIDDPDGRYKILSLRKHLPGSGPVQTLDPLCPTKPEFQFTSTFRKVTGTSVAVEYLRRTRAPGGSYRPAPAIISAHPGDWKVPMKDYAAWAHRAWTFRPYPSRLDGVATMIAVGWGPDLLFKQGNYRTDFLKPGRDCLELMSWWEWSPVGPWNTPFDQLKAKIGEAAYQRWRGYFVKDPVTGRTMWNNQPGDYEGYNERFGGLPVFRAFVETCKRSGSLITLYTDPFRLDESSRTGRAHGREWTVVLPDGEPSRSYEVWNPCHDLPEVREWATAAMARVLRETGADGIRLDEYGHRGWACYNPAHKHTFAEPGCTEWMRATAEASKMIRAAMDEVNPRSVLTTEHPGYDYLMPYLDGCITYDLTVLATPLRPLECNIQRFYFPECKAYELDHRGADRDCHKRFWNLVAAFGKELPPAMYAIYKEHQDVLASRDCEPLVPTLMPRVYANRFTAGPKTLWTLYNATGHTIDGPLLEVELAPGQRLVELLSGADLAKGATGKLRAALRIPRNGVACVARMP